MPSFARELEQTLHNALAEASQRRHEYATLEHLLLALTTDEHASQVMKSCGFDLEDLGGAIGAYLDNEFTALTTEGETDPSSTSGCQRAVPRPAPHVQSAGRTAETARASLRQREA